MRAPIRLPTVFFAGLMLSTGLGATCNSEGRDTPTDHGSATPSSAAVVDAGAVEQPEVSVDSLPMPTEADLPGYPLDQVLGSTAKRILLFAKDAFSYDGCTESLQKCLQQPEHKRHALRMLQFATRLLADGMSVSRVNTELNRYYASFSEKDRLAFDLQKTPCRGPEQAPVTLVEFSDFECPYCRAAKPLMDAQVNSNGSVRFCFKTYPLQVHMHAIPAAETALVARDQGKFWEMYDVLFEHQNALETADLESYAQDVGVDPKLVARSLDAHAHSSEIDASRAEGQKAQVHGTPTIFLNGRPLTVPLTPENLQQAIEDEVEWKTHGNKWALP
jgi:protein-disulfide isomerase